MYIHCIVLYCTVVYGIAYHMSLLLIVQCAILYYIIA